MAGNTVRLHRVLATRPEKIYRAFLDPDAIWQESLENLARVVVPEIPD